MSEILKPTPDQLAAILADHAKYLLGDGGKRANLSGADLRSADLRSADLRSADLRSADLSGANLRSADLRSADLSGADLRSADLRSADLRSADLRSADLRSADLSGANLRNANLRSADLSGANLSGANLRSANLRSADLSGANLRSAEGAELAKSLTEILPREGEVIAWKKCAGGVLAKLRIPPDAKRSNATGRKCRAEFVEVLEVVGAEYATSNRDPAVIYRVGDTVRAHDWCADRFEQCAAGIHFFLTREEAADYSWW